MKVSIEPRWYQSSMHSATILDKVIITFVHQNVVPTRSSWVTSLLLLARVETNRRQHRSPTLSSQKESKKANSCCCRPIYICLYIHVCAEPELTNMLKGHFPRKQRKTERDSFLDVPPSSLSFVLCALRYGLPV